MLLPALLIAGPVLGLLVADVGLSRLISENLLPVGFAHAEQSYQRTLSPFTFSSLVATAGRGLVYVSLLAGTVGSALLWPYGDAATRLTGARLRLRALWPLAASVLGLFALDGASRALGAFAGSRSLIQTDCKRLLIGMSWLPALTLVLSGWALARFARRRSAPLSNAWPRDLALIACAAVLSIRVYDNFTTDTFAPYYAAVPLLLAAIVHQRIGDRLPAARGACTLFFAAVVLTLLIALGKSTSASHTRLVRSAHGEFASTPAAAPALQRTIDFLRANTRAGEPILSLPYGALYFLVDRPPALYNLAFLPGDVDSAAQQGAATARLRKDRVRYVVLGNARFAAWGEPQIGVDYDRALLAFVEREYRVIASFGDFQARSGGPLPQAYEVYERR
jgi:hypothetical protein